MDQKLCNKRNRNTFEGLRYRHEFYQHPASLLRKETRLSTLFSHIVHVSKKLSKNCWTKSFFYLQNYKFWSINSFINYFLKEPGNLDTKFRAGPSPNYVGEVLDFFISNSEKALNTRLFWGTGEDGTGKCPFQQNSCYQETSSTTNWKPSATHRLLHSLIL